MSTAEPGRGARTGLRERVRDWLPRPMPPRQTPPNGVVRRLVVLRKGENPSFSYYFESRLGETGDLPARIVDIDTEGLDDVQPDGTYVVICRYAGARHLRWMEKHRQRLAGVALFVDDDIAETIVGRDTSLVYKAHLAYFSTFQLSRLNRVLTDVWVSTPELQRALGGEGLFPRLLPPRPTVPTQGARTSRSGVKIAFHAKDVHGPEHAFLKPVIEEIAARNPQVVFEVVARGRNRQLWQAARIEARQLEILDQMNWSDYRMFSSRNPADIFLVPLLDGPINAARADTKRIDACRLGAAAVFSDSPVYGRYRQPGEFHLPNRPRDWIAAIQELVSDEGRRGAAAAATRDSVMAMVREAPAGFPIGSPADTGPSAETAS